MREYHHTYWRNKRENRTELLLADKTSAKAKYGHTCPEYLDSDSPHFLREGVANYGNESVTIYQLTEPTKAAFESARFKGVGAGYVTVEAQQYGGWFAEGQVHESRITWK